MSRIGNTDEDQMKIVPRTVIVGFIASLCTLLFVGAGLLWVESYRHDLLWEHVERGESLSISLGEGLEESSRTTRLLLFLGLPAAMVVLGATGFGAYRIAQLREVRRRSAESSAQLQRAIIESLKQRIDEFDPSDGRTTFQVNAVDAESAGDVSDRNAPRVTTSYISRTEAESSVVDREARVWDGLQSVLSGRCDEFQLEYPVLDEEGDRWFLMRVERLEDSHSSSARVAVTHEEITAQVLSGLALLTGEALDEAAIGSLDDLVFALDTDLKWVGCYGHLAERAELSVEASNSERGPIPVEAALHEAKARHALGGEHVVYRWPLPIACSIRQIETVISPVRGPDGTIIGVVGSGRDVTAQTAREQEKHGREAILDAVAFASTHFLRSVDWRESIPRVLERLGESVGADRVYVTEYRLSNESRLSTRRRYEWTAPDISARTTGPSFQDAMWRGAAFADWRVALSRGETVGGTLRTLSDAVREALSEHGTKSLILVPIFVGAERVGLLGIEDCTDERDWSEAETDALRAAADTLGAAIDRSRIEEALVESEEQLQHAQKMEAIGRLAGGIAHDFNNLLTAITGRTELLLDESHLSKTPLDDLTEIRKATERAAMLTRQLLAFSRRQVLEPRILDLNVVIRDVESMLRRMIGEKIVLLNRLDPQLGLTRADPNHIVQVLMNLVVNARDALPDGGTIILATTNVEISARASRAGGDVEPGRYVKLSVIDDGRGIPVEAHERVFEPFYTTKEPGKGTGLGLSTVYGIVKQSGGHIWVESDEGLGTIFQIQLPRVPADHAAPGLTTTDTPDSVRVGAPLTGSETVLLAEDEAAVRTLMLRVLERNGYTVLEATNGAEAIQIAEQFDDEIHLLLTDVVMPGLGGGKVAEVVSAQRPDMRLLFMSGYTDQEVIHERFIASGSGFLAKPFTPDELIFKVRDVLDRRPEIDDRSGATAPSP